MFVYQTCDILGMATWHHVGQSTDRNKALRKTQCGRKKKYPFSETPDGYPMAALTRRGPLRTGQDPPTLRGKHTLLSVANDRSNTYTKHWR